MKEIIEKMNDVINKLDTLIQLMEKAINDDVYETDKTFDSFAEAEGWLKYNGFTEISRYRYCKGKAVAALKANAYSWTLTFTY